MERNTEEITKIPGWRLRSIADPAKDKNVLEMIEGMRRMVLQRVRNTDNAKRKSSPCSSGRSIKTLQRSKSPEKVA